ncbi:MAG TPA: acyl-CoA thioesterase [Bacteroidota bacterium]|nr:acyl-CoA thioesterase [Bacteroidota bacterium]
MPLFSRFETELQVRPDDIDMNQHVHNTRYLDYVLAARYDQMERCYKMSMGEFLSLGYGWVVNETHVEHKRPLGLGETIIVRTWIDELLKKGVKVRFEIIKKESQKLSCEGYILYTMINRTTGRSEVIPEWIVAKYSV